MITLKGFISKEICTEIILFFAAKARAQSALYMVNSISTVLQSERRHHDSQTSTPRTNTRYATCFKRKQGEKKIQQRNRWPCNAAWLSGGPLPAQG
jgi:hypothetical protein